MVGEEDDLGGQGAGKSATNQITSISQRLANMPFGGAHEADLMIRVGISPQEVGHERMNWLRMEVVSETKCFLSVFTPETDLRKFSVGTRKSAERSAVEPCGEAPRPHFARDDV